MADSSSIQLFEGNYHDVIAAARACTERWYSQFGYISCLTPRTFDGQYREMVENQFPEWQWECDRLRGTYLTAEALQVYLAGRFPDVPVEMMVGWDQARMVVDALLKVLRFTTLFDLDALLYNTRDDRDRMRAESPDSMRDPSGNVPAIMEVVVAAGTKSVRPVEFLVSLGLPSDCCSFVVGHIPQD